MTATYVCPYCGGEIERGFSVQYLVRSCSDCGEHGRFVHRAVAAALEEVSTADMPDGWAEEPLDERLLIAVREGVLDVGDARARDGE
ncbi:hypothetical protein BRC97_06740 [Halobacteriales archaeon QS_6_71_20]|nr:MAG: hypothetical protein BRC97_06740 [Halobacteriales archaeon QS_6_71_20]